MRALRFIAPLAIYPRSIKPLYYTQNEDKLVRLIDVRNVANGKRRNLLKKKSAERREKGYYLGEKCNQDSRWSL